MSCLPGKHFISNFELSPVHDVLWPVCSFQAISVHIVLINLFFFILEGWRGQINGDLLRFPDDCNCIGLGLISMQVIFFMIVNLIRI